MPSLLTNSMWMFGYRALRLGSGFILGAWLARMEVRLVFEELLKRVDRFELNGDIRYLRSNFIAGIKHLPVRVTS